MHKKWREKADANYYITMGRAMSSCLHVEWHLVKRRYKNMKSENGGSRK